ncbi:hypothetical protein JN12_02938 [Geobacter argillaceus]|uniref:histidine kinase n=2 Tax=Geobacter argillaceus TaxID=345631 RepID=A0A562VHV6_9BACT|nr:hypothetical protein JN12_02938 [Geobacter argillaceus]
MSRLAQWLPWLLLVVGLLVTLQMWKQKQQAVERNLRSKFDSRVQENLLIIKQRMVAYEQVLRGARGLFAASGVVARRDFYEYVAALRLSDNYPGIQGVGYSLIVPAVDKQRHIDTIRAEGFPNYTIKPEGERETYTAIIYLEPFTARNLRAFGYDMYSERVRRAAMERARDTGRVALSGKVRLVQEPTERQQAGVLIYLPVYQNGKPRDTVATRRSAIVGWVYAPFRMDDLMAGLFGQHAGEIDIEIYDGQEISKTTLLHDADKIRFDGMVDPPLRSIRQLEIAGRIWTVTFRALPSFAVSPESGTAEYVASTGIVLSLFLTLTTWMLAIGRARTIKADEALAAKQKQLEDLNHSLEQRVYNRTAELERLNRELESFCYSISHEMRAPIARLEGFSRAIEDSVGDSGSDQLVHYAERLGVACRRMRSVIDGLLLMYRITREEMVCAPVDLSQISRGILAELLHGAGDRTITVTIAPGVVVLGDRRMLRICLQHLLCNAVKYSARNPEAAIEFGQMVHAGEKVYFVRDNGAGFDMAFAGKLFEPFCRLHSESEFEGSGIGLPTVHRVIERHGGRIWAEAEPGKGATFFFTIRDE